MESMDSPTDPASRLVPLPGPASSQSQAPVGGDKDEAEDREDRGPGTGGLVLILVCLALGAALSWGWREHGGRRQVLGVLDGLRVDSAMAQARQSQLAELLMDPQTTLIHLVGKHENASRQAVVAWNASRSAGIFVCEGLPPPQANQEYHLWLLTDAPDKQDHPAGIPAGSESGAAPSAEAARVDAGSVEAGAMILHHFQFQVGTVQGTPRFVVTRQSPPAGGESEVVFSASQS